jgi:hypothetical protein
MSLIDSSSDLSSIILPNNRGCGPRSPELGLVFELHRCWPASRQTLKSLHSKPLELSPASRIFRFS